MLKPVEFELSCIYFSVRRKCKMYRKIDRIIANTILSFHLWLSKDFFATI